METIKKTVPQWRFKEFKNSPDWETKKLGDLLKECKVRKKNLVDNFEKIKVLSVNNKKGFIDQIEQYTDRLVASSNLDNYKVVYQDNYAFNPSRINVGSIARLSSKTIGLVSPMYIVFSITNNIKLLFFDHYLSTFLFKKMVLSSISGSVRDTLSFESMLSFPIPLPSLKEQERISEFLTGYDQLINLTEQKLQNLIQQKKGYLQKLFPQKGQKTPQWRFKEFKNSPDWETKKLGDMITLSPTKKYQINTSKIKPNGIFQVIDQGKSQIAGYSDDISKVNFNVPVIVYGDHTTIVKYINQPFILGGDGVKLFYSNYHLLFIFFCIQEFNVSQTGYNRHWSLLKTTSIPLPSLKEQERISEFLTGYDQLINLTEQKLQNLIQQKKGYLQKLFPSSPN